MSESFLVHARSSSSLPFLCDRSARCLPVPASTPPPPPPLPPVWITPRAPQSLATPPCPPHPVRGSAAFHPSRPTRRWAAFGAARARGREGGVLSGRRVSVRVGGRAGSFRAACECARGREGGVRREGRRGCRRWATATRPATTTAATSSGRSRRAAGHPGARGHRVVIAAGGGRRRLAGRGATGDYTVGRGGA